MIAVKTTRRKAKGGHALLHTHGDHLKGRQIQRIIMSKLQGAPGLYDSMQFLF